MRSQVDTGRVIEDIYPLTPLQQGMLFHTLKADHAGPYVEQFVFDIRGAVDAGRLSAAWNLVVARHPALRTSFVWQGVDEPHQVVLVTATVPLVEVDHSGRSSSAVDAALAEFLAADRDRGISLEHAPLMRLCLMHVDGGAILVWTVHHLVLDGWSLPIILREVAAGYRAGPGEPPPAVPFRRFVEWLEDRDHRPARRYWLEYLGGARAQEELNLRPGLPEERRGSAAGGTGRHDLDAGLSAGLAAAAATARVTLGTLFQAAWAVVLARHIGDRTVTFGLTMAGRPTDLPGVEGIVGPFINTVPRRVDTGTGLELGEWLREIQRDRLDCEPHQHTSLVEIGSWLRRPAEPPLFDTILVVENYPNESPDYDFGPDVRVAIRDFVEDTAYPLTVMVLPRATGLRLQLLYDEARYAPEAVTTLLGRLENTLAWLVAGLGRPAGELDVLGPAERDRLLEVWNDTARANPFVAVHDQVARTAAAAPEAIAIEDHGVSVTYADLDRRAAELAAVLAERGVGPEVVVALLQHRTADLLVSVLAVLKAGGAYLALDPDHPDERLSYLLRDSRAALLLVDSALAGRLDGGPPRLVVDRDRASARRPPGRVVVGPGSLCYVTYTSGSTGRPKGIAMTHGAVANLIAWQVRQTSVAADARTFGYASLSFDVSFQELFATWCAGGTLVLVDERERVDFERLVELARRGRVQRWYLPAFALEQVAATAARLDVTLPELREVIAGSEPLHVTEDLRRLLAHAPGCRLENQYGPSECHVVTSHVVTEPPAGIPDQPPIGRPLDNTRVYLLDDELRPVPAGVTGALYLAGSGVARGYLGRPGLTAERFVPCPYPIQPGERMYDTGDRARYRPDGSIEFLGRVDNQVKIRGFRIELGEIEAVLREQPDIRDALAMVTGDGGERRIVGYVVPAGGAVVDGDELRDRLRRTLPEHMVPVAVAVLDAFPLTVNRKVDRAALPVPVPAGTARAGAGDERAARTPSARLMTDLWASVLAVEDVGLDDDFFLLGGHSLLAVRLIGRLRELLLAPVSVGAVFTLRTPRRLLEHVARELGGQDAMDAAARRAMSHAGGGHD